jgi:hypothetical protein
VLPAAFRRSEVEVRLTSAFFGFDFGAAALVTFFGLGSCRRRLITLGGSDGPGAFRHRIAFVDESRLRWRLDARSGHFKSITLFKSISLGQRTAWLGNACGYLGHGPDGHCCTPRWSFEFHCRKHSHTQWDEEAQHHHSQHDVPPA